MVTNYRRGYDLENKLQHLLEAKGYLVMRSSGSHTALDLLALPPPEAGLCHPQFIQCKKTVKDVAYLGEFTELVGLAQKYAGDAVLVYSLRRTAMFARPVGAEKVTIRRTDINIKAEEFF